MSHLRHRTIYLKKKVMSHLRHRRFYKKPPRGPIFIDGSIVTKVCYSISPPWLAESVFKKTCEKCQQILSPIKF